MAMEVLVPEINAELVKGKNTIVRQNAKGTITKTEPADSVAKFCFVRQSSRTKTIISNTYHTRCSRTGK